jgi:glucans biosynthesis protein
MSIDTVNRRRFLGWSAALLAGLGCGSRARADEQVDLPLGKPTPFSFEWLTDLARTLASQAYSAPQAPSPSFVQTIDFDASQHIRFRKSCALWEHDELPVRFFHLNKYVGQPVRIARLENGIAREVIYTKQCFQYDDRSLREADPPDLGFSGFRVMDGPGVETDWLAFQGASYFRSSGSRGQYGSSARGIAVNTATEMPEEFPRFSRFWIEQGDRVDHSVIIHALLEGSSVTGAYRFVCRRDKAVVMDVEARLFPRGHIDRLGLAPLTGMYWYGENTTGRRPDWRPEIHDCDGLAIWTGSGERIWRPLIDPPRVLTNSFLDNNPKGFGLLQRDHDFNDYQDDGAFYDRRPSVWVEPLEPWGEGAVQLVQIPTNGETDDNIVAYWTPKEPVSAGKALSLRYRLHWSDDEPYPPTLARVVATRIGRGGIPGAEAIAPNRWKFVVDYEGGPLSTLARRYDVQPMVTASHGTVDHRYAIQVVGTHRWRSFFDLALDRADPVELRCYLRLNGQTLSETWSYQFFPPAARELVLQH